MFSEELSILDKNTVMMMIEEQQETIEQQKKELLQKEEAIELLRGFLPFLPTARIRQIKISFSYILAIRTCCFLQHVFYTVPKGIRYKNHVTY